MVAIFKKKSERERQRMESAKETFRVKFLIESNSTQKLDNFHLKNVSV